MLRYASVRATLKLAGMVLGLLAMWGVIAIAALAFDRWPGETSLGFLGGLAWLALWYTERKIE